ncbi:MAG: hypothetical protein WCY49_07295, partial [Anaerovoracaceae bacterium]
MDKAIFTVKNNSKESLVVRGTLIPAGSQKQIIAGTVTDIKKFLEELSGKDANVEVNKAGITLIDTYQKYYGSSLLEKFNLGVGTPKVSAKAAPKKETKKDEKKEEKDVVAEVLEDITVKKEDITDEDGKQVVITDVAEAVVKDIAEDTTKEEVKEAKEEVKEAKEE